MRKVAVLLVLIFMMAFCLSANSASSTSEVVENSWSTKASMQVARAYLSVAVVNGKIYAIGGDVGSIMGNVVPGTGRTYLVMSINEEYDPSTNNWTRKARMPTARALFGAAVYQNKIYCIGGYHSDIEDSTSGYDMKSHPYIDTAVNEVYDPATDSWSTKASMPVAVHGVQANTVGDEIYVTAVGSNATYVYNPATDSWAKKSDAPYEIDSLSSAVVDEKIYTIGSHPTTSGYWDVNIQAYNAKNDHWDILAKANSTIMTDNGCGATSGINTPSQICFFDEVTTSIYNPTNNSWASGTPMPSRRLCAAVAVVDDAFYVIGGRYGQWGYITMEFPSAMTEQYIPFGYKTIQQVIPDVPAIPLAAKPLFTLTIIVIISVSSLIIFLIVNKTKNEKIIGFRRGCTFCCLRICSCPSQSQSL